FDGASKERGSRRCWESLSAKSWSLAELRGLACRDIVTNRSVSDRDLLYWSWPQASIEPVILRLLARRKRWHAARHPPLDADWSMSTEHHMKFRLTKRIGLGAAATVTAGLALYWALLCFPQPFFRSSVEAHNLRLYSDQSFAPEAGKRILETVEAKL